MVNLQYYKLYPLIVVIIALSGLGNTIAWILIASNNILLYTIFSTFTIAGGIKILDEKSWKHPIMNWYGKFISKIPNLNGEYEGYIEYTRGESMERKHCLIKIIQTLSTISIQSSFFKDNEEKTESENIVEEIRIDKGVVKVNFYYHNKGGLQASSNLAQHNGFCELKYDEKEKSLTGFYFTNRNPQTKGGIFVQKTQKNNG